MEQFNANYTPADETDGCFPKQKRSDDHYGNESQIEMTISPESDELPSPPTEEQMRAAAAEPVSEHGKSKKNYYEKGIQEIILKKDKRGKLGLKVKNIKEGIYVMEVVKSSPVDNAGIRPGDRILQINGIKVDGYDEERMHEKFKRLPSTEISMVVNKRPLEKTVTIKKDHNGTVGFQIRNTKVYSVIKNSPAEIQGLSTDYYLLDVSGVPVRGKTEDEIRKLIKESGESVTITVMPAYLYEPLMKQIPIW